MSTVQNEREIPPKTQVLVIGGGPGGSYAATLLAIEGFDVTLLEKDEFPRYHIGESLLPSTRQFLEFVDAIQLVEDHGFTFKPGAVVKLNQHSMEGYTDFSIMGPKIGAWNVVRSEFDDILLKHAARSGVNVFTSTQVQEISFGTSPSPSTLPDAQAALGRPTSATWKSRSGKTGSITFDWLIDASGRAGIMSTRYLKSRVFNKSFKNSACWGYWSGAGVYGPGTPKENAPWFEALTDESGWCWFIPLNNGTVSVGVVENEEISIAKRKASRSTNPESSLRDHYLSQIDLAPGVKNLLSGAQWVESDGVKSASDYSYNSSVHSGEGFRLVGDAGAFIDPFFSSGVHLAFNSAFSAACSIAASIRGHCTEEEANAYHDLRVGTSYTRFLIVVLGVYKQIKSQNLAVLQDVNEAHFDRAFTALRPIIQGSADTGHHLTTTELTTAMDFASNIFLSTTPQMHSRVLSRVDPALSRFDAPILLAGDIARKVGEEDEEARRVLEQVNARKVIRPMMVFEEGFGGGQAAGFGVVLERGRLGLKKLGPTTRSKIGQ